MAFCKYCGNEIPEGGVCSCPGAQAEAQGQNAAAPASGFAQDNNVYGQGGADQNNNNKNFNPNELVEKAKKNPAILIGAVAGVIVLIVLLALLMGGAGAKGAAKKFAKATAKGKGKTILNYTLPDDVIKELKDDDKWKDMVEESSDAIKDLRDDGYKVKIKSVTKGKKLNGTALKGAEKYWEKAGADDPEAKKGYEFKIKSQTKYDGEKNTSTTKICVVKFKGEGWKVLTADAESLKSMGESKSSGSSYGDFDFSDLW